MRDQLILLWGAVGDLLILKLLEERNVLTRLEADLCVLSGRFEVELGLGTQW
jgi:hypothetical protein